MEVMMWSVWCWNLKMHVDYENTDSLKKRTERQTFEWFAAANNLQLQISLKMWTFAVRWNCELNIWCLLDTAILTTIFIGHYNLQRCKCYNQKFPSLQITSAVRSAAANYLQLQIIQKFNSQVPYSNPNLLSFVGAYVMYRGLQNSGSNFSFGTKKI